MGPDHINTCINMYTYIHRYMTTYIHGEYARISRKKQASYSSARCHTALMCPDHIHAYIHAHIQAVCEDAGDSGKNKHQTLLFSATVPSWVQSVAKKYLRPDMRKDVDLVIYLCMHVCMYACKGVFSNVHA
jgi:hypothetical protein